MKNHLSSLLIIVAFAVSCKKSVHKSGETAPELKKYNCFCTTTIAFVDFCRTDTTANSNIINTYTTEEAGKLCNQQNYLQSSNYTVTTKSCEIK